MERKQNATKEVIKISITPHLPYNHLRPELNLYWTYPLLLYFVKCKGVLGNSLMSLEDRESSLVCYVESVLPYCCEYWELINKLKNTSIESSKMCFTEEC